MMELRSFIVVVTVLLLVATAVFPWTDAWPVEDVNAYLKSDPYHRYTAFLPEVKMVPFWERPLYAVAAPFWPVILLQLGTILGFAGWAWTLTRLWEARAIQERAAALRERPEEPPYCGAGAGAVAACSSSVSGTVGP